MKLKPFALACFLLSATYAARADYLFTWHSMGVQQVFQGSFAVTDAEIQSNAAFGSALFTSSISVTSPDGITYHDNRPEDSVFGQFGPPFELDFQLWSDNNDSWIHVEAGPPNGMLGVIAEWSASGEELNWQQGAWSVAAIPEPSATGLLAIGTGAWLIRRKMRARS